MKSSAYTSTSFRNIYLGILSLWLAVSVGVYFLVRGVAVPTYTRMKANSLDVIVQSQASNLPIFLDRDLRDQLAHKGFIRSDKEMKVLVPGREADHILDLLGQCLFITPSVCANESHIAILARGSETRPLDALAVVFLESSYLATGTWTLLWALVGAFVFGLAFLLIAWGTRRKAQALRANFNALNVVVANISKEFEIPSEAHSNEFSGMARSLEQVTEQGRVLSGRIGKYKEWLSRHTSINELHSNLSHAAHDIRAPLEEGRDLLRYLPQMIETLPKERLAQVLDSASRRFADGVDALSAAMDSTKAGPTSGEHTLGSILEGFRMRLASTEKLKIMKASVLIDPKLKDVSTRLSRSDLTSTLWNLAQNSAEADAKSLSVEVEPGSGESVRITVSDDGSGIPAALRDDIFLAFASTKPTGTGIGLASVKSLIEKSGGRIELIASRVGSTFEIEVPVSDGDSNG